MFVTAEGAVHLSLISWLWSVVQTDCTIDARSVRSEFAESAYGLSGLIECTLHVRCVWGMQIKEML